MYKKRLIEKELNKYIDNIPWILVEGAKAVGKTEMCSQYANTILSLDNEDDKQYAILKQNDLLSLNTPILIDEWQYVPQIWNFVRHDVDNGAPNGSFIFTGSSPKIDSSLHTGAGRVLSLKLRPFSIEEREMSLEYISLTSILNQEIKIIDKITDLTIDDYIDEIYKSGFPGIRKLHPDFQNSFIKEYVEKIVFHEFILNGIDIKKPSSLLSWLKAYAACLATPTPFSTILEIAMSNDTDAPAKATASNYRDALLMINIIEEVPMWLPMGKLLKNIGKAPKHFMVDTALATSLLSVEKDDLRFIRVPHPIGKYNLTFIGQIFESFVYQSLRVYCDVMNAELSHYRSKKGDKEVDFIIQKGRKLLLIEVKATTIIKDEDVKHLNWLEQQVQDEYKVHKICVYAGKYAKTREDQVHCIPAGLLGL